MSAPFSPVNGDRQTNRPKMPANSGSPQGSAEKLRAWMDFKLAHLPKTLPRMGPGTGEAAWPIGLAKPAARVKEPV